MTVALYAVATLLLAASFALDRAKTKQALKKTVRALMKLLPDMAFILLLVGLTLSLVSPDVIANALGDASGILGIALGITLGSVSLLPSVIAFPLGATLLENGAGLLQIGGFIAALMGVGVVTFPLERKFFGGRFAVARNLGAIAAAMVFVVALWLLQRGGAL